MKTALDLRAIVLLVVLCGSWGLNQVAVKVTFHAIPPALQMGARSAIASVLVFVWCLLRGKRLFERDGSLWPGLTVGLLFGVEFLAIFWGLQFTTASRAVIIIYLMPFIVAAGGYLFLDEPLGARKVFGLVCAFLGVVLVFSDGLSLPSRTALLGDALCVFSAFLWAATTIVIKRTVLRAVVAEKTLLYQLVVSAAVGLVVAVALGERIEPANLQAAMPAFLYQAVWVAAITYVVWFALVRDYPASLLSAFTFLTPLFGVASGALILHEPLSPRLLVALVLVAAGIYLVNRGAGRAPNPRQPADADAAA